MCTNNLQATNPLTITWTPSFVSRTILRSFLIPNSYKAIGEPVRWRHVVAGRREEAEEEEEKGQKVASC